MGKTTIIIIGILLMINDWSLLGFILLIIGLNMEYE